MFRRIPKIKTSTYTLKGYVKVKVAAAAILVLLPALILPAYTLTYAESDESSAYAVNSILEKAISKMQMLVAQERGSQKYEALNKRLGYANELAERVQKELRERAYQQALNSSMEAFTILSSVAAELRESEEEQMVAAKHSALRMGTLLGGVKNLTEAAAAKGYDVSVLKRKLEDASRLVEDANSLYAKGDFSNAGKRLAESRSMLGQVMSDLSRAYEKEKVELVKEFVNKTLSRIYEVEAEGRFIEQVKELNSSRHQLQSGKLKLALKNINEVMKQMEKKVNNDLKNIKEELVSVKKQISDLQAKGVNVEKQRKMIEEASRMVEQAALIANKGDYITAKTMLTQAESILRSLR